MHTVLYGKVLKTSLQSRAAHLAHHADARLYHSFPRPRSKQLFFPIPSSIGRALAIAMRVTHGVLHLPLVDLFASNSSYLSILNSRRHCSKTSSTLIYSTASRQQAHCHPTLDRSPPRPVLSYNKYHLYRYRTIRPS